MGTVTVTSPTRAAAAAVAVVAVATKLTASVAMVTVRREPFCREKRRRVSVKETDLVSKTVHFDFWGKESKKKERERGKCFSLRTVWPSQLNPRSRPTDRPTNRRSFGGNG